MKWLINSRTLGGCGFGLLSWAIDGYWLAFAFTLTACVVYAVSLIVLEAKQ